MIPTYRTETSKQFIKVLKKFGFKRRTSIWDKAHETYFESVDMYRGGIVVVLFSFNDTIFRYTDVKKIIEYYKNNKWVPIDYNIGLDIPAILVLYK